MKWEQQINIRFQEHSDSVEPLKKHVMTKHEIVDLVSQMLEDKTVAGGSSPDLGDAEMGSSVSWRKGKPPSGSVQQAIAVVGGFAFDTRKVKLEKYGEEIVQAMGYEKSPELLRMWSPFSTWQHHHAKIVQGGRDVGVH